MSEPVSDDLNYTVEITDAGRDAVLSRAALKQALALAERLYSAWAGAAGLQTPDFRNYLETATECGRLREALARLSPPTSPLQPGQLFPAEQEVRW